MNAYRDRLCGERAENVEQSIHYGQLALRTFSKKEQPWKWASAHTNLGNAWMVRVAGERGENVERAIQLYHAGRC